MTPPSRLEELTGDLRQLASVRQVTLADGGGRALVFSTGGGLDFWVLQDRSMDIGALSWRGLPLAWAHPADPGPAALRRGAQDDVERWLGGFLFTCGLDNPRQPAGGLPLHGSLPGTPARLLACGVDWDAARPVLFAEAEVTQAHLSGPCFRLRRRIEAPVAGNRLVISDRVQNIGPEPAEMKILYHMNFGFPMAGPGLELALNGAAQTLSEPGSGTAQPPRCLASGGGGRPHFTAALHRPQKAAFPGLRAEISGAAAGLPFLQVWQDARPRRNILAVEPSNCSRNADGTSGPGTRLAPGETWSASLAASFGNTHDTAPPEGAEEEIWQPFR